jgi:hypothetical protein
MTDTTLDPDRAAELLALAGTFQLREIIATERELGRAFGRVAELARVELAKRCEQA